MILRPGYIWICLIIRGSGSRPTKKKFPQIPFFNDFSVFKEARKEGNGLKIE